MQASLSHHAIPSKHYGQHQFRVNRVNMHVQATSAILRNFGIAVVVTEVSLLPRINAVVDDWSNIQSSAHSLLVTEPQDSHVVEL